MIKKLFISLLTIVGLGISFSDAVVSGQVVNMGSQVASEYNNQYKMMVNSRSLLYTQFGGVGKQVLMFNKGNFFTWTLNGLPYVSFARHDTAETFNGQGVSDDFLMCDSLSNSDTSPSNCADYNYLNNSGYAVNILKNANKWYYGTFYQDPISQRDTKAPLFCFSSDEFELSVCFYACINNCGAGDKIGGATVHYNLHDSLGLSLDLAGIDQTKLGTYPGAFNGGTTEGSTNASIDTSVNGDYAYSTCTNKDIIDYAEYYGYSEYLCYAGSNDRDYYDPTATYQFYPGTGVDLGTLFNYTKDGKSLFDWFRYWRGMYNGTTGNVDNALWQQQPAVLRLWFYAFITYGGDSLGGIEAVHEYCLMKKMVTGDALNHKYTGSKFQNTCRNIVEQKVNGTYLNDPSYTGTLSGAGVDVPVSVNWGGVGNLSGGNVSDPLSFLQNFFNQLKTSLNTNAFGDTGNGFIPGYIIIALLGLIIFRFLSH